MSISSGPWAFHRLGTTKLGNERTLILYGEGGGRKRDEDTAKLESKYFKYFYHITILAYKSKSLIRSGYNKLL